MRAGAGSRLRQGGIMLLAPLCALLPTAPASAATDSAASPAIVVNAAALALAMPALLPGISDDDLDLRPGTYVWDDPAPFDGPISIFISLQSQRAWVWRGKQLIGIAAVSTGRRGKETPVGTYSILQKRQKHRSNLYANAPMPYMQRLTWDGIALHAGRDPGFPASHGCVRLPFAFAQKLFGVTQLGVQVIVSRDASPPGIGPQPRLPAPVTRVASRPAPPPAPAPRAVPKPPPRAAPAPYYMTVSRLALLDSDVTAPIRPVPVDMIEPLPATPMLDASQPHWVHQPPPAPWLPVDPAIFIIRRL